MSNKLTFEISKKRLVAVMSAGLLFVGGTAFGLSATNTPSGGYLLCTNKSTRAVSYPGVLKCPPGTSQLVLGARGEPGQAGSPGPQGPAGPQGSAGSSTMWNYVLKHVDIVGPGEQFSFAGLKKVILADISKRNLSGGGNYDLRADLTGIWADNSPKNSYLVCYFQDASDYPNGAMHVGGSSATITGWTGIDLTVWGEPSDNTLGLSDLYLVCATDGNISGLSGLLTATSYGNLKDMGLSPSPSF